MSHADLQALLCATKPRERSGSQTAARYDFQSHYGILKLLDLREDGADFRMIFDLHDDLLVLNSGTAASTAAFYQIKSRDRGDWSTAQLCRQIGSAVPRSIASRLYAHVHTFGIVVTETGFVTNAPFRMKLTDGSKTSATLHQIRALELHTTEQDRFARAAIDDFADANVPAWLPKLVFLRTSLGVHEQELVVIGRLQKHFEHAGVDGVKVSAVYETLRASITQKSAFSEDGLDLDLFMSSKSLSRSDIDELLASASTRPQSPIENWEIIRSDLAAAGMGSVQQIKLHTAALRYYTERKLGHGNAERFARSVRNWTRTHAAEIDACATIVAVAAMIRATVVENHGYSDTELVAASLVEAYEAIHEQS